MSRSPTPLAEHPPLSAETLEALAARFRVLGAPSRLKILDALMGGSLSMRVLAERVGLEPSNLSRHVAELESAGCVSRQRLGREVHVEIADPSLRELCQLVCGALREQAQRTALALGAETQDSGASF